MATLRTGPTTELTILSETPEAFVVEAAYAEGGGPPPAHLHPAQDETFEVLEGRLRVVLGDEERTLDPGDRLAVPRGTAPRMWNEGGPARVLWETRPALRTPEWFRVLDGWQREGMEGVDVAAVLAEYDDVFRLTG